MTTETKPAPAELSEEVREAIERFDGWTYRWSVDAFRLQKDDPKIERSKAGALAARAALEAAILSSLRAALRERAQRAEGERDRTKQEADYLRRRLAQERDRLRGACRKLARRNRDLRSKTRAAESSLSALRERVGELAGWLESQRETWARESAQAEDSGEYARGTDAEWCAAALATARDRARALLSPPPPAASAMGCTGLTARWCPVHGACSCPRDGDLDSPSCPLHAPGSDHAEPRPAPSTPARCACTHEAGDSPCPVHGMEEEPQS